MMNISSFKARRTIVVVGATGTIGSALVRKIIDRGDVAICVARDQDKLEQLLNTMNDVQKLIEIASIDVSQEGSAYALASQFRNATDLIVAMGSFPRTPSTQVTRNELVAQMIEHCAIFVELARAFAPNVATASGAIIGFSDNGVDKPYPNHIAYLAAKGALVAAARALALEWSKPETLVRVGLISIGVVTDPELSHPERRFALAQRARVGRIGTPDEVAHVTLAMLDATWVSGEVWSVGN